MLGYGSLLTVFEKPLYIDKSEIKGTMGEWQVMCVCGGEDTKAYIDIFSAGETDFEHTEAS